MSRLAVVIEDNSTLRHLLAELLAVEGFDVKTFDDASPAAEIVSGAADLLLLDWLLPSGTPMEFLRRLVAQPRRPHCLIVSGCAPDQREFAVEYGARLAFLAKPFTAPMLREAIERLFAADSS